MLGYPWIYWLVVLIVAGAVSTVLIGIGYLLGLKIAARRVATVREEIDQARADRATVDLRGAGVALDLSQSYPPTLPGPRKGCIR